MGVPTRYRWLLHVDLDQFQVSVERQRRPELVGQAVIVGGDGDPTRARQVVTCASYEARADGVRAGMPMRAASKKAPDAVFLPLDMGEYEAASERVMDVLRGFGDALEVWGWDEAYLGIEDRAGPRLLSAADVIETARSIRRAVVAATGLDCCVGVSDNKQRAKAATGFAKQAVRSPEAGEEQRVFVLDDGNWASLMNHRPCRELWSVGSRTAAKLSAAGIDTVAQLAAADRDDLTAMFGPHQGDWLYVLCRGGGDDAISDEPRIAKSHSKARTYDTDLTDPGRLHEAVRALTEEVLEQVVAEGRTPFRVGLTVRTATFFTRTKMRKLPAPTTSLEAIAAVADDLLDAFEIDRPIRLLAVRLELLDPE
ncbi:MULTISPECIES: DNA polymerase IV [Gordonia]|uniref:DNA-directed DNA polymerase n=1 Tax=Gordonia sihwensis NBRC 108236 TaxID=1223544 RepID=L7LGK8_9ACTN|nr:MULTISPECIES: DNA polymerase IV [Gordonia]AUH69954.1 DNA polymerase IV [Gordonia sp. YC-JH1]MBY4570016.1 DNA polymerase IV [Gordonia sihwensis]GAC59232.1 DNA polymerase IV [Gordonia sihwensis NBRC 108236]